MRGVSSGPAPRRRACARWRRRRSVGRRRRARRVSMAPRNSAAISRRRSASSCIAGRYCSNRSLPLRLATYIARSASRSSSTRGVRCAGDPTAMPDAHVHGHLFAAQAERRAQRRLDAQRRQLRARRRCRRSRGAPRTRRRRGGRRCRRRAAPSAIRVATATSSVVTGGVTEAVVDDLEVVEIEEQHGHRAVGALGAIRAPARRGRGTACGSGDPSASRAAPAGEAPRRGACVR